MPPATLPRDITSALRPGAVGERETQASYYTPFQTSALGVIPRRGLDAATRGFLYSTDASDCFALDQFAKTFPLRLLSVLLDVHPLLSCAARNNLSIGFGPGDTQIVALEPAQPDAPAQKVNTAAKTILDDLWNRNGGLVALQRTIARHFMWAGLTCMEGVPGPRGTGIAYIADADPASIWFRKGNVKRGEPPLVARQKQADTPDGWKDLNPHTVFVVPLDGDHENPYGRPLFGAALSPALSSIRREQVIDKVLDSVAWPRLLVGFPLVETMEYAKQNWQALGLENPEAELPLQKEGDPPHKTVTWWVWEQFRTYKETCDKLSAAKTFLGMKDGTAQVIKGGGLSENEGTLEFLRHEIVMGVGQPPSLLGITMGGTEAYSSVQWRTYAKQLESLRALVNAVLVRLANLHFQLLGLPFTARADVEPIRTEEQVPEQQARGMEIDNEAELVRMGFSSPEDACINLTGTGIVDPEKAAAYFGAVDAGGGEEEGAARQGPPAEPDAERETE